MEERVFQLDKINRRNIPSQVKAYIVNSLEANQLDEGRGEGKSSVYNNWTFFFFFPADFGRFKRR